MLVLAMKVSDIMTRNPQTLSPTDLLSVAIEKMQRGRFSRLPVVDDEGRVIGMIANGDLRQHVGYAPSTTVRAAMAGNIVTVSADAATETAAELMAWHKIGGLPVVDGGGKLIGIVTESDLLHVLVDMLRAERQAASTAKSTAP